MSLEMLDSRTVVAPCRVRNGLRLDVSHLGVFIVIFLAEDGDVGAEKVSIWFD